MTPEEDGLYKTVLVVIALILMTTTVLVTVWDFENDNQRGNQIERG